MASDNDYMRVFLHGMIYNRGVHQLPLRETDGSAVLVAINKKGQRIATRTSRDTSHEALRMVASDLLDVLDEYEARQPLTPFEVALWRLRRAVPGGENRALNGGHWIRLGLVTVDVPDAGLVGGDVIVSEWSKKAPPVVAPYSLRPLSRAALAAVVASDAVDDVEEDGRGYRRHGVRRPRGGMVAAFRRLTHPRYMNLTTPTGAFVLDGPKDFPAVRFSAKSDAEAVDELLASLGNGG